MEDRIWRTFKEELIYFRTLARWKIMKEYISFKENKKK